MHRSARRTLLAATAVAAAAIAPAASAPAADAGLAARLREYEKRVEQFDKLIERLYRGETVTDAHRRVNELVDAFNADLAGKNAKLDAARKDLDRHRAPVKELSARIEVIDAFLKNAPDRSDREAVARYNAQVEERNRLVLRHNELNETARVRVEAYNALVERTEAEIALARSTLSVEKAKVNARIEEFERLQDADTDVALYVAINRLYADLKAEQRRGGQNRSLAKAAEKVRGFRRELGLWATRSAEARDNGLIIVEATLSGNEPAFFILDTGAMQTTISREMVDALGLADRIGEQTKLVLAGGEKIQGNRFTFPEITASGHTEREITGVVVKPSDIGIDGLLGQSFLKRFVYTIDETKMNRLILRPRLGR
jgi:predicted aspartyl protease